MAEAKEKTEYFAKGVLDTNLEGLKKVYKGKVRDVYEVDEKTSLFVVSDRISSFDRVMTTPVPGKGKILNQLSEFWFNYLEEKCGVKNHMITCDIDKMPKEVQKHKEVLKGRCMLVKKLKMIPVEAVCRAYLTGSGFKDYQKSGAVCGHKLPEGLRNCQKLPSVIFTPATKAAFGDHDENITEEQAAGILKKQGFNFKDLKETALKLFGEAVKYAESKGIIIADTKFEMGLLEGLLIVGDEVLTPDSSRYWDKKKYVVGQQQDSLDKQYVRDYLISINFDRDGGGVPLPKEVCEKAMDKYKEIFKILTGKDAEL